jgi:hypothetical protein
MFRTFKVLGVLLMAAAFAAPALALPAPMSAQELFDKSDLVAVVRVLSVSCTGVSKDAATGQDLPSYLGQLQLVEVKKGEAKPGDVALVTWHAISKTIVGPWTVPYYPGEEVLTHLAKRESGVAYASTWWNAKGEDVKQPASTELPTNPGEAATPPKNREPGPPIPLIVLGRLVQPIVEQLGASAFKARAQPRNVRTELGEVDAGGAKLHGMADQPALELAGARLHVKL